MVVAQIFIVAHVELLVLNAIGVAQSFKILVFEALESGCEKVIIRKDRVTARFDPFRLQQVLFNLVSNALQHNAEPIAIRISTYFEGNNADLK